MDGPGSADSGPVACTDSPNMSAYEPKSWSHKPTKDGMLLIPGIESIEQRGMVYPQVVPEVAP